MEKLEINTRAKPSFDFITPTSVEQVVAAMANNNVGVVEQLNWNKKWVPVYVPTSLSDVSGWLTNMLSKGQLRINPTKKNVYVRTCIQKFNSSEYSERFVLITRLQVKGFADYAKTSPYFLRWADEEIIQNTVENHCYVS